MLYAVLHLFSFIIFKLFFNLKVEGRQNIPRKGGAILASNHASYADVLLIGCGIWRRLRYVAKAEIFENFFSRVIWTSLGGIPINRRGVNRNSFKKIIDQVEKKRNLVVIFPEGTRSTDGLLKEAKMGIGMLVSLSGAKVIPAYISGSEKVLPVHSRRIKIHPVSVTYGEPVDFSDLPRQWEGKELYQRISSRIMESIHELKKKQDEISQTVADSKRISLK